MQTIANLARNTSDNDLSEIADVLRQASDPVTIVQVAKELKWEAGRTAEALARGGQSGLLRFSTGNGSTSVSLSE